MDADLPRRPASTQPGRWWPAGPPDLLAEDSAVHIDLAGQPVCLARSQGAVYALFDECSHGQVALSDGEVSDGLIECWQHGSRFSLSTGVPIELPATRAVRVYPVRVTATRIEVALCAEKADTDHD